jgi:tetraacyldisaccharide 4'-kinase
MKALLAPISLMYGLVTGARNIAFDMGVLPTYKSQLPTFSIGNLSVGGNAKTPLVIWLAAKLRERGESPLVLSRGYGGSVQGPVLVTAKHTAAEVGDEPLLMHAKHGLEVVVCASRVKGAQFAERHTNATVLLLDDGMQHRWLTRDVEILTVDVSTEKAVQDFLNGRLIPWGRFRESKQAGLKRVNVVVAALRRPIQTTEDGLAALSLKLTGEIPSVVSEVVCDEVVHCVTGERILPQPVIAWCAIANPDGFTATLEAAGFKVVASLFARDHKLVNMSELNTLVAKHPGVPLVCTEKDIVKYSLQNAVESHVCKVSYRVSDEQVILGLIEKALNSEKRAAGATR